MISVKDKVRLRFRVCAFLFLFIALVMGFVLAFFDKDVTAFGVVVAGLSVPTGAVLVADYATKPSSDR